MDKAPDSPGLNNLPWPEDPGSEQDFGATGVFKALEPADAKTVAAVQGAGTGAQGGKPADPFYAPTFVGTKPLAEPVVHKVVLGGGAESSPELLDRMRMASQEKTAAIEKPAAAAPAGAKGGGGFTELLRTLEVEMPASTAAKSASPPESRPAAQDSGFTSLLRTLDSEEPAASSPAQTTKIAQPAPVFAPAEPMRGTAAPTPNPAPVPGAGGFTELLRAAPGGDPMMTHPQASHAGAIPPVAENKPGTFTQLFGTLGGTEAMPSAPPAVENKPGTFTQLFGGLGGAEATPSAPPPAGRAGASAGSFTRMLSLEPTSTPAEQPTFDENKSAADLLNFGPPAAPARPAAGSSTPFSPQPFSEPEPAAPIAPSSSGVGITRLIRMLDEPSNAPMPPREAPPMSTAGGTGPGVWTQTFASLNTPNEPLAATAKTPDWAPPQAPPTAPAYPAAPAVRAAPIFNEPVVNAPPAAAGPSEFTRILDASRMRELAMRGSQAAAAGSAVPVAPPQAMTPAPSAPLPSYPPPVAPPAMGMPGGGAVPRPAVYPPSVPQAPGMYVPTPQVPQAPGMYVPAPQMPSAPPPPPPKPAAPAAGGLQQLVPILLIVVIVLLLVLIVTVIFLMKH